MKHTYISVHKDHGVILKSRRISLIHAKELILLRASWIINKIAEIKKREDKFEAVKNKSFDNESEIKFLGKMYKVNIIENVLFHKVRINFDQSVFNISVNPLIENKDQVIRAYLDEFYREQSIKLITPLIKNWSEIMQLYPKEVKFRKVKKRWGSCSYDNKLSLSLNIVQLTQDQASYIIVHELAHIKEKNHSRNFWALVEKYLPDYKVLHKDTLSVIV